jgi:hypothetical protein
VATGDALARWATGWIESADGPVQMILTTAQPGLRAATVRMGDVTFADGSRFTIEYTLEYDIEAGTRTIRFWPDDSTAGPGLTAPAGPGPVADQPA